MAEEKGSGRLWLGLGFVALLWGCGGAAESGGSGGEVRAVRDPATLGSAQVLIRARSFERLSGANGFLYWNAYYDLETGAHVLRRMAERGGAIEKVVDRPLNPFTVLDGWIYGFGDGAGLDRVDVGGGAREAFVSVPRCYEISHTATALYCADGLGITRIDLESGQTSRFGESRGYLAEDIVVDESSVYWTAAGQLSRVAQTGGPTEVVTTCGGSHIAGDSEALYFGCEEQLCRWPKSGGARQTLTFANARNLEVFGGYLYWIEDVDGVSSDAIKATSTAGDSPNVVVAVSAERITALAVTDAGVFWASHPGPRGEGALYAAYWAD